MHGDTSHSRADAGAVVVAAMDSIDRPSHRAVVSRKTQVTYELLLLVWGFLLLTWSVPESSTWNGHKWLLCIIGQNLPSLNRQGVSPPKGMVGSKILSITGTELHRRILPCIEYAEFQGGTNEGSGGSGSLSSDGFTEAVTQVDRTTVYSSGAGDGYRTRRTGR